MKVKNVAVNSVVPYARNPRQNDAAVAKVAASIKEFGWRQPIVVDEEMVVIAGHTRLEAARLLGLDKVPVHVAEGMPPAKVKAYRLADNRTAQEAEWLDDLLAQELQELQDEDYDLALTGFSENELAALMADVEEGQTDPDDVPELPEEAITKPGDLWLLGQHRLLCGDCRDSDSVKTLMGGEHINVAVTSPPYAEQREYDASSGFKTIAPDDYVDWYSNVAANIMAHITNDGSYFLNIKPPAIGLDTHLYVMDLVIAHARIWGWHFATEFCWERSGVPKGVTRRFKNQFEPVYQFSKGEWKMRPDAVRHESDAVPKARGKGAGNTSWAKHQGGGSLPNITFNDHQGEVGFEWFGSHIESGLAYPGNRLPTFSGSHKALGHAASFPVGLPEFFIKAFTDEHDVVFDPFMGSGSTLIAAEQTGRRGHGIEISPIYCDVIVTRWQEFTGKKATLDADGRSFAAVAKDRNKAAA